MKKYKVKDVYEGTEVLGYVNNIREVKKLAKQRYEDTDGECLIEYRVLNILTLKYDNPQILKTF